jgi:predicted dehydrogenase
VLFVPFHLVFEGQRAQSVLESHQKKCSVTSSALKPFLTTLFFSCAFALHPVYGEVPSIQLIVLDPGHFHASLIQEHMYPQVSPVVHVYAPAGPDLQDYLNRVELFNSRSKNPTRWEEKVHAGPDFLEAMLRDKAGNVVVIAGNNRRKTEYIDRAVRAGFNVFGDKPIAITPAGFDVLRETFVQAANRGVLLYDIMTERFQITTMLQRDLARMPDVFGGLEQGAPEKPAVVMESVHHIFKEVSGKTVQRPAWFFDVTRQGEAIPDVGTHLVDLVQWECFPNQALDWHKDVRVQGARRWPTTLTFEQFKRVTGLNRYPDFLAKDIATNGSLSVYLNGEVNYTLRGVHVKVTARWDYEAPPGAGDTHYSLLRGTRASLVIRQGPQQAYRATLYVESNPDVPAADFERALRAAIARLGGRWPGLELKPGGAAWQVVVPERFATPHEDTFARVTENYLRQLAAGKLPDWEVPNMLAKYYTTTEAYRLSHMPAEP